MHCAMFIVAIGEWDLMHPHIMRSICAMPHSNMSETTNLLMRVRELQLPNQLFSGRLKTQMGPRETNLLQVSRSIQVAQHKLRNHQQKVRTQDMREPLLFQVGAKVWPLSKKTRKHESGKLLPKFISSFLNLQIEDKRSCPKEHSGRVSQESGSQLEAYCPIASGVGMVPRMKEPNRQLVSQEMATGRKRRLTKMTDLRKWLDERPAVQRNQSPFGQKVDPVEAQ